jgi:sugar/nucleoside kinase (ribokinase family)
VGAGWQGLVREFTDDGWVNRVDPMPSLLLEAAGLVVASLDDLDGTVSLDEMASFAPNAAIVLTAGEGGGLAMREGKLSRYRAVTASNAVDPTGAGDVFLAALMAAWLMIGERATAGALRFAAAAASCVVEGTGLAGVPTAAEVAARARSAAPASADPTQICG